jgi:hypothetical protein
MRTKIQTLVASGVSAAAVAVLTLGGSPAVAGSINDVVAHTPTVEGNSVTVVIDNNTALPLLCNLQLFLDPAEPTAGDGTLDGEYSVVFAALPGDNPQEVDVPNGEYHVFWLCTGYATAADQAESSGWTVWGTNPPLPVENTGITIKEQFPSTPLPVVVNYIPEPDPVCLSVCMP